MILVFDMCDGVGYVLSWIGMKCFVIVIEEIIDIFGYIWDLLEKFYCVLVDEV